MSETRPAHDGPQLLAIRAAIGLAQGLGLYVVFEHLLSAPQVLTGALGLSLLTAPIVALGAVGRLRGRILLAWLAAALLIATVLGGYDGFIRLDRNENWPHPAVFLFTAAALFVLHHLILAAQDAGRWRAPYSAYFDDGWRDAVRLGLGVCFVGALWLLLLLGAALFKIIGITALEDLLKQKIFSIPISTLFFAIAIHLTDVKANLVAGARTLALTLLAWLLPVLTGLTLAFLAALPFTGLQPLWDTRSAGGILLSACAALLILINAAYQDGERDGFPPGALKWSARLAGAALAPMALIAAYGVALRIGQHGLTPDRIYSAACVFIAACYAAGYLWAALARGPWMARLETVNWLTAQVCVAVVLLLFSPILDPVRLSVGDQVRRLHSGKVAPDAFDYRFLRFDAGRPGQAALRKLAADASTPRARQIAGLALAQLSVKERNPGIAASAADRAALLSARGGPLPADFLAQTFGRGDAPERGCYNDSACVAFTADLTADPGPEIVVANAAEQRVFGRRDGRWTVVGELRGACPAALPAMRAGDVRLVPAPPQAAFDIAGRRFVFQPQQGC